MRVVLAMALLLSGCGRGAEQPGALQGKSAASTTTVTSRSTATTQVLEIVAPLTWVDEMRRAMIDDGSALVGLDLDMFEADGTRTSFQVSVRELLWAPSDADQGDLEAIRAVTAARAFLVPEQQQWLARAGWPQSAVAVLQPSGLIDWLAPDDPVTRDSHLEAGTLYLGAFMQSLVNEPPPVVEYPPSDPCGEPTTEPEVPPSSNDPVDLLVAFLTVSEAQSLADANRAPDYDSLAEEIAESTSMIDPVTGQTVYADVNHIRAQLENGVDPEDIVIAPVVVVGIDYTDLSESGYLVLVAEPDDLLGWVRYQPLPADSETLRPTEVRAPAEGRDVLGYLFEELPDTRCPTWLEHPPTPNIVVPWDVFAGEGRTTIHLADQTIGTFPPP